MTYSTQESLLEAFNTGPTSSFSLSSNGTHLQAEEETCNSLPVDILPSPTVSRFICSLILVVVGMLGLAGNLISLSILSRPNMRSSINCCLMGLTTFDMIVTTTSILMFGLTEIGEYTKTITWYTEGVFQRVTPFVFPLALIAQTGSVYLTVTVTVERYVVVCWPLRARSLCTYGRAKIYVISVAFFSIIYNIPRFWEVSYQECYMNGEKSSFVVASELRLNQYYIEIYIMWMYLIVMYLVPFLSLIVFNFFIYQKVRAANLERQHMSRLQQKEISLAVMLLVVVTVFFVCNVLAFIINILELLNITIGLLTMASNLLVTINSSVNFIIYCIFSKRFRKLFLKMLCSGVLSRVMRRNVARGSTAFRNNSAYGDSRKLSSSRTTQIFRLSSRHGSQSSDSV